MFLVWVQPWTRWPNINLRSRNRILNMIQMLNTKSIWMLEQSKKKQSNRFDSPEGSASFRQLWCWMCCQTPGAWQWHTRHHICTPQHTVHESMLALLSRSINVHSLADGLRNRPSHLHKPPHQIYKKETITKLLTMDTKTASTSKFN